MSMWGLTSTGAISVNVIDSSNNTFPATSSSILSQNVWTHIVQTFSSTNGNRLYINGALVTSTSASGGFPIGPYIFVGSSPSGTSNCKSGSIVMGQFYGSIDELRIFGQELTATDICRLANP